MGLDTTHNAWHGTYSSFRAFRYAIMDILGMPPLGEMQYFHNPSSHRPPKLAKPIQWTALSIDPRWLPLLLHSDCDGELTPSECAGIADVLEPIVDKFESEYLKTHARQFAAGCRLAAERGEVMEFH